MLLTLRNLWTDVRASPLEDRWLARYLSFKDAKARHMPAVRAGKWDGRYHLYRKGRFPTGLTPFVARKARSKGMRVDLLDLRQRPGSVGEFPKLEGVTLRPDQMEAIRKAVEKGRGVIQAPTGSGKTELYCAIVEMAHVPFLLFVHRIDLLHQAADRYERRTGKVAGRIGEGLWEEGDGNLTVLTFQTAYTHLDDPKMQALLHGAQGVIGDECHLLPAITLYKTFMATPNAYYRLGGSATPLMREDRRSVYLLAACGPVLYRIKSSELIDQGILSRPTIRFVTIPAVKVEPVFNGTWLAVYQSGIVRSDKRNELVARVVQQAEKPCLVFVKEIDHGRRLQAIFASSELRSQFVWGQHVGFTRQQAIRRLEGGKLEVVVCSTVFDEGVDIPGLRSVVAAGGGKSSIKALQRLGRGMRRAEGKQTVQMWDFYDTSHPWLQRHSEQRRATYLREGLDVRDVPPLV